MLLVKCMLRFLLLIRMFLMLMVCIFMLLLIVFEWVEGFLLMVMLLIRLGLM